MAGIKRGSCHEVSIHSKTAERRGLFPCSPGRGWRLSRSGAA
jgi:hypothetical protein